MRCGILCSGARAETAPRKVLEGLHCCRREPDRTSGRTAARTAAGPAADTHSEAPPTTPQRIRGRFRGGAAGGSPAYFVLPDEDEEDRDDPELLSLPVPRLEEPVLPVEPEAPEAPSELEPDDPVEPLEPVSPPVLPLMELLPTDRSEVSDELRLPLVPRLERHLLKSSLNFL